MTANETEITNGSTQLNMNSKKITGVADGTLDSDCLNKLQVDTLLADKLTLSTGGTMGANINMNGNEIFNLGNTTFQQVASATNPGAANNKIYFKTDGKLYDIDENDVERQYESKAYIDQQDALALHKDGSVQLTGNLDLNTYKITGSGLPSSAQDLVPKAYIDYFLSQFGIMNSQGNLISSVSTNLKLQKSTGTLVSSTFTNYTQSCAVLDTTTDTFIYHY